LGEAVRDERRRQISQSKTAKPKSNGSKRDD